MTWISIQSCALFAPRTYLPFADGWHTSASHSGLLIHIQWSNDKREKTKIPLSRGRTNKVVRDVANSLKADVIYLYPFVDSTFDEVFSSLSPFRTLQIFLSSMYYQLLQVSPLLESILMILFDGFGINFSSTKGMQIMQIFITFDYKNSET